VLHVQRDGVAPFVSGDLRLMLKGEPNFVQPFQQAFSTELIDLENGREPMVVVDLAVLQVNRNVVILLFV